MILVSFDRGKFGVMWDLVSIDSRECRLLMVVVVLVCILWVVLMMFGLF